MNVQDDFTRFQQHHLPIANPQLPLPIQSAEIVDAKALQRAEGGMQELDEGVCSYVAAALAQNSRRAYRGDLEDFHGWGGTVPCSPGTLAAYVADRARIHSPHTITRRVVGISRAHASQDLPDPAKSDLVRVVLRGVRKAHGRPQRQAAPLLKQDLLSLLPLMRGIKGIRDRALILLGFAAALRRSEIVALDRSDIEFVAEGMVILLRRSKTDQEGQGRRIAVPYGRTSACPVKAVQHWLAAASMESGPLFRFVTKAGSIGDGRLTSQSVNLVVKCYVRAVGLDSACYSGHSLRSGLATSAAQAGVPIHRIMMQTGHRSAETLARYVREANLFENNAAGMVL